MLQGDDWPWMTIPHRPQTRQVFGASAGIETRFFPVEKRNKPYPADVFDVPGTTEYSIE